MPAVTERCRLESAPRKCSAISVHTSDASTSASAAATSPPSPPPPSPSPPAPPPAPPLPLPPSTAVVCSTWRASCRWPMVPLSGLRTSWKVIAMSSSRSLRFSTSCSWARRSRRASVERRSSALSTNCRRRAWSVTTRSISATTPLSHRLGARPASCVQYLWGYTWERWGAPLPSSSPPSLVAGTASDTQVTDRASRLGWVGESALSLEAASELWCRGGLPSQQGGGASQVGRFNRCVGAAAPTAWRSWRSRGR